MELLLIVILSFLLVPLAMFTLGVLRIALGLIFVLFFPGYILITALFPRKNSLGGIQRLTLSFGLSIVVVSLLGLLLSYTPWGINLYPILISVLMFIVIMAGIAWYRRQRLSSEERFQPQLGPRLRSLIGSWSSQGQWDKVLSVFLVLAILGAIGTIGYVIAKPAVGERFTEFYILGPDGKAENYLREVTLGEEASVILGVVNQEYETTVYHVDITIDGEDVTQIGPITLNYKEKWKQEVAFTPVRAGPNQKVEFLLYKGVDSEPYYKLQLSIDVEEAS